MLDVFLCHATSDRAVADAIKARLERCAEARVWLEEIGESASLLDEWEGGLSSAAIILLLSPDAVPSRADRDAWRPILDHNGAPPIGVVLVRECAFPPLLKRLPFFRWTEGDIAVIRSIEQWIMARHQTSERDTFQPARNQFFTGREEEFHRLMGSLVDSGGGWEYLRGPSGAGKSTLAQEFTRRAADHFREIVWIACSGRSASSLAGELAAQLGVRSSEFTGEVLQRHRLLVVLDDLTGDVPFTVPSACRSSVLVTTRACGPGLDLTPMEIPWTVPDPADEPLWKALSTCRTQGASLHLAATMIGWEPARALESATRLVKNRVIDPLDAERFRITRPASSNLHAEHARAVLGLLSHPGVIAEVLPALARMEEIDWSLAKRLGRKAADFLRKERRNAECVDLLRAIRSAAQRREDQREFDECEWELSWLEDSREQPRSPLVDGEQMQLGFVFH